MKDFFEDIFGYHHHFNQKMAEQVLEHLPRVPQDAYTLFCHTLNAHQIWNSRVLGQPTFAVQQLHPHTQLKDIDATNYSNTLHILNHFDLAQVVLYRTSSGQEFTNSVRDILFHVSNHSTHHRAQLAARFRALGITPLASDFIFYKREQA